MAGHFVVDGRGGDSDVVIVNATTFTVPGAGKNFTATADFIGTGRVSVASPGDNPGILECSGNVMLVADGDSTITSPSLFGAGGVWSGVPTTPVASAYLGTSVTSVAYSRGSILHRGVVRKTAGADATATFKARANIIFQNASPGAGTVTSTSNKLHTILWSDSDNSGEGAIACGGLASITTNGGNVTMGGGTDPALNPARGLTGNIIGLALTATSINTGGGNLSVRGLGTAAANALGVRIGANNVLNPTATISTGAGSINIVGTGGNNTTGTIGVVVQGDTAGVTAMTQLLTTTGAISITGTAGGGNNPGVNMGSLSNISSANSGTVTITGTGAGIGAGLFMAPAATFTATLSSTGGAITITADMMDLNGGAGTESITIGSATSGSVTLKPLTASKNIALGSGVVDSGTQLAIDSGTELPNVTAGTVTLGDNVSGTLTVTSLISPSTFTTLGLASGTGTTFSATSGFSSDVTSASVFEKITVSGTVTISAGATLATASAGGYIWNGTDAFTFLDNDASDAISGTFTGPTLTNFLGSTLTASQSYSGGTGNDLVIFAALSSNADLSALVLSAGSLSPAFAAVTTAYSFTVGNASSTTTVTATRADANATLQARVNAGSFSALTSGAASGALALNVGSNTVDVKVTAQDGTTLKTYTTTITRRSVIEDWRLSFFSNAAGTSTRADAADFDSDTISNLMEFAFGTDPTSNSSGPPPLVMSGTYAAAGLTTTGQPVTKLQSITNGVDFRSVFIRRTDFAAAGLTYTPQFSADLATWTDSLDTPAVLATSGGNQLVSVPYPHFLPNGKKARFFRISVSITP